MPPELKFALIVGVWALFAEVLCASPATSMPHELRFESTMDPSNVTSVGVLWNGLPATSGTPLPPDDAGVWRFQTHVEYGSEIRIVLINRSGLVSPVSNMRIFDGCWWDVDGNKRVGGSDFSAYLLELGGDATPSEFESFESSFGLTCP